MTGVPTCKQICLAATGYCAFYLVPGQGPLWHQREDAEVPPPTMQIELTCLQVQWLDCQRAKMTALRKVEPAGWIPTVLSTIFPNLAIFPPSTTAHYQVHVTGKHQ